jgi:hypothetical protein
MKKIVIVLLMCFLVALTLVAMQYATISNERHELVAAYKVFKGISNSGGYHTICSMRSKREITTRIQDIFPDGKVLQYDILSNGSVTISEFRYDVLISDTTLSWGVVEKAPWISPPWRASP